PLMSDAISSGTPDDSEFESIVAGLDMTETGERAATPPSPTPCEQSTPAKQMASPAQRAPVMPETAAPQAPDAPELPTFPLQRLLPVGLAMTVVMAATGQVLFWQDFFGGGTGALLAAVAIAAAFEVIMIGATDRALSHKAGGSRWWRLLFPMGATAAIVAAGVQLLHWDATMGIPFAAAALIGWAAHATSGWITAQHYRQERDVYDAEIARRDRKAESRADAEYDRAMAEVETTRQAANRAVAEAAAAEPAPEPKPAPKSSSKSKTGTSAPRLDRETAREWSQANGNASQAQVRAHFEQLGYRVPAVSTLRGWLNNHQ